MPPNPEAARLVRAALASRGFREASSGEAAQLLLSIDSGIGRPRVTLRSSWETPPVSIGGGNSWAMVRMPNTENTRMTSTSVWYHQSPLSRPIGSPPVTSSVVVREQYLRIAAYENSSASTERPASEIWSVRASIEDVSDDLREHLPMLVSAATEAIGKGTRDEVKRAP